MSRKNKEDKEEIMEILGAIVYTELKFYILYVYMVKSVVK